MYLSDDHVIIAEKAMRYFVGKLEFLEFDLGGTLEVPWRFVSNRFSNHNQKFQKYTEYLNDHLPLVQPQ